MTLVFFIYHISLTRTARRTEPNMRCINDTNPDERQASIRGKNSPRAGASLFAEKTEEWV